MTDERTHHVTLRLRRGYEFEGTFDDLPDARPVLLDEPPPLGDDHGPNAAALLGAAVGDCLAASLTFCLRKTRVAVDGMTAHVVTHVTRNEKGRFRISGLDVEFVPDLDEEDLGRLARCEDLFEDFCVVTESVRRGIPVTVSVTRRAPVAADVVPGPPVPARPLDDQC